MTTDAHGVLVAAGRLADALGPVLAPADHDELLRSITQVGRQVFDAAACSLAVLDDDGQHLRFKVATGVGADAVVGLRLPVNRGIAGYVAVSGQPIEITETSRDPRFARDVAEQTGYVPRAILAMPVATEQRTLGVIEVLDRRADEGAGTAGFELLAVLARQAAIALDQALVFRRLGVVLLRAAADAADDGDLQRALFAAADATPGHEAETVELAAHLQALLAAGPAERRAAVDVLAALADYAARRRLTS